MTHSIPYSIHISVYTKRRRVIFFLHNILRLVFSVLQFFKFRLFFLQQFRIFIPTAFRIKQTIVLKKEEASYQSLSESRLVLYFHT